MPTISNLLLAGFILKICLFSPPTAATLENNSAYGGVGYFCPTINYAFFLS